MSEENKLILLAIMAVIASVLIAFILSYHEPLRLSIYGDIDDASVKPIMTCGKLLETIMYDKPWVKVYTIGYAYSTNKFYIRYEFTYDEIMPHRLQYTKWQLAPMFLIAVEWDNIELFAGRWLPPEAYPFDSPILRLGG